MKSITIGSIRISLSSLGLGDLIIGIRSEAITPEKKVKKVLFDLRNKLRKYLLKKRGLNPEDPLLKNIGISLEFDDEINDFFLSMG